MKKGMIQVLCGEGSGKSACAIGLAVKAAGRNQNIVIIQFLKGRSEENEISRRLEPEIKLFRFQKREEAFENLTEQEKEEEIPNLKNGLNFARKVLATGECDVLILDEVLGLPEREIATLEELHSLLEAAENTDLIFTGIRLYPEMLEWADEVYEISVLKESE